MYNYDYFDPYQDATNNLINSGMSNSTIWLIVSIVVAIIGGVVTYFLFVKSENKTNNKYLISIKNFFDFKTIVIEDLLKVLYLGIAIYITLSSFMLIPQNFLKFLVVLVGGNVLLRLVFEAMLIMIMIWKNTNEINKKMKK